MVVVLQPPVGPGTMALVEEVLPLPVGAHPRQAAGVPLLEEGFLHLHPRLILLLILEVTQQEETLALPRR